MMGITHWASSAISDCLDPISLLGTGKIQARDYKQTGRFPVIDQGQEAIAGWTDDEAAVIRSPLPLIVFGDHTRTFKFVDFPFARGADGTQVLRPKAGIDPLFFFYACRSVDLPSRGYNRHYTLLKEKLIPLPDYDEQVAIGAALRFAEHALNKQHLLIAEGQALKRAAMQELFTRGLRSEPQKDTEVGLAPESWKTGRIADHHTVVSGGTPSRGNPDYWEGGTIPWVKTTEIDYNIIHDTEESITPAGLKQSAAKLLPPGILLMAMYGQGVTRGKVAILGIEAACNQACAAIRPTDTEIDTKYLFHFLASRYEKIRQMAHGGQQQNLNLDIVRDLQVAYPEEVSEQFEIVAILDAIDDKIDLHRKKLAILDTLFKSLLYKLMSGEVRASDLDLSLLPAAAPLAK